MHFIYADCQSIILIDRDQIIPMGTHVKHISLHSYRGLLYSAGWLVYPTDLETLFLQNSDGISQELFRQNSLQNSYNINI